MFWIHRSYWSLVVLVMGCVVFTDSPLTRSIEGHDCHQFRRHASQLDDQLQTVFRDTQIPGLIVLGITRRGIEYRGEFGYADRSSMRSISADHLFAGGSLSKILVGLSVAILQDEGKLDLNDPVADLVPDIPISNRWKETDPVRLIHLLEHTSGFDDLYPHALSREETGYSLKESLERQRACFRSRWRPGTCVSYSNAGYGLSAYVIERVSGVDYEQFVEQRICEPLGIESASFFADEFASEQTLTEYAADGVTVVPRIYVSPRPTASIHATAAEMAKLVQLLLNRGASGERTLIRDATIRLIERPQSSIAARLGVPGGYGCGLETETYPGGRFHFHGGLSSGTCAEIGYSPQLDAGWVTVTNCANDHAHYQVNRIVRKFLIGSEGLESPSDHSASGTVAQLSGYYEPVSRQFEKLGFLDPFLRIKQLRQHEQEATLAFRHVTYDPSVEAFYHESALFIPTQDGLLRRPSDAAPVAAFRLEENGKRHLYISRGLEAGTYRAVATWMVWSRWLFGILCLGLMATSPIIGLPGIILQRLRGGRNVSGVRSYPVLPIISVSSLILTFCFMVGPFYFAAGRLVPFTLLGTPSIWSIGFTVSSIVFAGSAIAGLVSSIFIRDTSRVMKIHAIWTSIANVCVLVYLVSWGFIGWIPWSG